MIDVASKIVMRGLTYARFGTFRIDLQLQSKFLRGSMLRMADYIQKKYDMKIEFRTFPPDLFWRDDIQVEDFLPNNGTVDLLRNSPPVTAWPS